MKLMESTDRLVWMVQNANGEYMLNTDRSQPQWAGSMMRAHIWKLRAPAKTTAKHIGATAVPFVLVEVDPDSIPLHAPKPVRSSADLSRLLESKI